MMRLVIARNAMLNSADRMNTLTVRGLAFLVQPDTSMKQVTTLRKKGQCVICARLIISSPLSTLAKNAQVKRQELREMKT